MSYNNIRYAGLFTRFAALLIDLLFFCALFFPVTRLIKGEWIMSASDHRWNEGLFITDPLCISFLIFMFVYFVVLEGLLGSTIGKHLMKIEVVSSDRGRPGLIKGFVRNLLRLVDGLPALNILGVVLILTSRERARFGDRIASTRVIKKG